MALGQKRSQFPFGHGNEHAVSDKLYLVDSYHCSRYNTSTKVLTVPMFKKVVKRASVLVQLEQHGAKHLNVACRESGKDHRLMLFRDREYAQHQFVSLACQGNPD